MISLGILSWHAHKTLRKTLETMDVLLPLVDEAVIFFNEITEEDRAIAKEFGFRAEGNSKNLGIMAGTEALLGLLKGDQLLSVQNDCPINVPADVVKRRLNEASEAISQGTAKYIQLHHRLSDGMVGNAKFLKFYPMEGETPTLQHRLRRLLRPFKARSVRGRSIWSYQHPEIAFPEVYQRQGELLLTTSQHLNFSEQPYLASASFISEIFDYCAAHRFDKHTLANGQPTAEIILNGHWWRGHRFPLAVSEGIFAHARYDDSFRSSHQAYNPNLDASFQG